VAAPKAVLLDVGGIFFVPDRDRIVGALARAEAFVDAGPVDDAHYLAAARFTTDLDVETDWSGAWRSYLETYLEACGVEPDQREEAHRHLDSEFADAALWSQQVPGSKAALAALTETGVAVGIVSNADGLIAQRLREAEILQVGPGPGVEVSCVIDSGAVGVMKPDPRIFRIALEAMGVDGADAWYLGDMPGIDVVGARRAGLRPFVLGPASSHEGADYEVVGSLAHLVDRVRDISSAQ
jgi:putative hydrolase of the HAD superfamily